MGKYVTSVVERAELSNDNQNKKTGEIAIDCDRRSWHLMMMEKLPARN